MYQSLIKLYLPLFKVAKCAQKFARLENLLIQIITSCCDKQQSLVFNIIIKNVSHYNLAFQLFGGTSYTVCIFHSHIVQLAVYHMIIIQINLVAVVVVSLNVSSSLESKIAQVLEFHTRVLASHRFYKFTTFYLLYERSIVLGYLFE